MAQNSHGEIYLYGQYSLVLQCGQFNRNLCNGGTGLYAAKLTADDGASIYMMDLGLDYGSSAAGIALDTSGDAYLAGTSSSPQFSALAGVPSLGADFVLRLDSTGAKAHRLFRIPKGVVMSAPIFEADGRLMLPGAHGALLHLPPGYAFDSVALVAFANSASYDLNTGLYPGALVSLFGFNLPAAGGGAPGWTAARTPPPDYLQAMQF